MKIDHIDILLVDGCEENPLWTPVLCRVVCDNGLYGDGEAAVAFAHGSRAAFGALQDIAPLALGQDPLDIERVWNRLYYESFWGQNGGLAHSAALSALDMALWDIKGKHEGQPLHQMLGGAVRDELRVYASQIQNGWGPARETARTPERYAELARYVVGRGYDAVKVDFLAHRPTKGHYEFVETGVPSADVLEVFRRRLAAVRDAVGPDVDIAVEGHAVFDVEGAIAVGTIAQEFGVVFFEEPTTSHPELIRPIREALDVPLALGERLYTRWQFRPFFEEDLVDLVQPDMGTAGGISEVKRICACAQAYGKTVQLHDCGTPLLNMATIQVEATLPSFAIHEHHVNNLHEYNKRLCVRDIQPTGGVVRVPQEPGLGNEISDYAFRHSAHVVVG